MRTNLPSAFKRIAIVHRKTWKRFLQKGKAFADLFLVFISLFVNLDKHEPSEQFNFDIKRIMTSILILMMLTLSMMMVMAMMAMAMAMVMVMMNMVMVMVIVMMMVKHWFSLESWGWLAADGCCCPKVARHHDHYCHHGHYGHLDQYHDGDGGDGGDGDGDAASLSLSAWWQMIGKGKREGFDHKGTDNPLVSSKNYVWRWKWRW